MKNKGKSKRRGYTTGTCAAAAAKAAAWMLLTGTEKSRIHLTWKPTPDQLMDAEFALEEVRRDERSVSCAVRKDAGDDIDVTDGLPIFARVSFAPSAEEKAGAPVQPAVEKGKTPEERSGDTEDINEEIVIIQQDNFSQNAGAMLSGLEAAVMQDGMPLKLEDLQNEDGVIPFRWNEVADLFSPGGGNDSPGGRLLAIMDDADFSDQERDLITQLFPAAFSGGTQTIVVEEEPDAGEVPAPLLFDEERFPITGGEGIGVVTKPGLDQPPGEFAINSVPRKMIREAVEAVCEICEYEGRLFIEILAPGGDTIAAKTFNPRLGIEGGISILGTTGIVEPMSGRAVSETVRAEVRVKAAASSFLALVPGNTGAAFVNQELLIPIQKTVIMSNYPGDALDEAQNAGVKRVLITGSLGKLIKLAGGVFYTHSRDADVRMDIMMRCALRAGASAQVLRKLDACITTEAALDLLEENELLDPVMEIVMDRTLSYLHHRAADLDIQVILLRNSGGVLAFTDEAFGVLEEINE